ncbi:MAG: low temperature requirement protein A [Acidimicrobiia bacterium]|nr:low temperature requirement protein A [Acidimicrobiia bacterium]
MVERSDRVEGLEGEVEELEEVVDELEEVVDELEKELVEKTAHPLELFFDLVFVFALTQVVSLIVHDLTVAGVLRGALLLALMWWAWTNWTWTSNVVDLEPRIVRVAVLASMLGVFGMAFAVPTAFEGDGLWMALGYLWVRLIPAAVIMHGARHDPSELRAILRYLPISLAATFVVVIGGAVGGEALQWIWLGAFCIELVAAASGGQADWTIDAGHFAERHGLILIIALGEAIIAVGIALEGTSIDVSLAILLAVGLASACALWWAYFDRLQEVMESALRLADAHQTGLIARDVYSLLHYPMIVGIVFYAVALEEAFLHPDDPMEGVVAVLFVVALGLYLLAQAAAVYRCWGTFLYERVIGVAVIAVLVAAWDGAARDVVLVSTVVLIATMSAEYLRFRARIRGEVPDPQTQSA